MPTDRRRKRRTPPGTIAGRYRIGERIARGGMSTVYRAHDEQLSRPVAVKLMRADLGEDPEFVRRFIAEARSAASVSHPNVVAVYDVGTDKAPYIVMELVERGDAAALLRREGRLQPLAAARIAAETADALEAAHRAGLVHRDVKPGNILIGPEGRALVADFGIARATGEDTLTRPGAALGSVEYFSPEQARGERAGPASDVYALGVVLYELLTGRRPFVGDSPYATATARLDVPPPDPRKILPEIPDGLAEVVRRAMAQEPADRYGSAGEMRDAVRSWIELEGAAGQTDPGRRSGTAVLPPAAAVAVNGRPSVPAERNEGSRRQGLAPLVAALCLVALVGVGFVGWGLIRGDDGAARLPGVIVGSPGGMAIETSTPSPTPTITASPTPTVASATPAPQPSTATPAPQPPAETPIAVAATTPEDSVMAFYGYVEAGRFDEAYALWSARMRADYPRQVNLDDRFADTADITFTTLSLASQSGDRATVQANFTETYDSGSSRQFVGYWELVRVDGRWLLDHPTY
ncbi:MAG TPA: protein kinase [Candidatus Limnocylindria bacterium]|nr:protein kinase [Candidatus Limnocylindria bacterium]